ncbi:MAG TPA: hypothetical protein ENJ17_01345 [Gammaproteobacteria bacterium]|nr:hypothetical protein [Gammaproteobacteria bacterium]
MTGVQRFFANNRNVLREAVLAASGVKPSAAIFRRAVNRDGNGTVKLTGAYTGADDATFDVEIVTDVSATPRVSSPVFSGVGNGLLSGLAVSPATPAETFTVRLADLGSDTTPAGVELSGVMLSAKAAGAAGNAIYIEVDDSGIAAADMPVATLTDWAAGQAYQVGDQWDFGGKPLQADGCLDASTPRIRFGNDPQVYRQYRKYEDRQWRYYLTPAPVRDIPEGTVVRQVTGSVTVTVRDGVSTDTHANIVTVYDLLSAIRTSSTLLDVVGVVSNDCQPDGTGVTDLPLRTSSWVLPVKTSGSPYAKQLDALTVAPTAPTEVIKVTCVDNDAIGYEKWDVKGEVSGKLPGAVTGIDYDGGVLSFSIPRHQLESTPKADVSWEPAYQPRNTGEEAPPLCIRNFVIGAKAASKSITFTYSKRPSSDCGCDKAVPVGKLSATCLGLDKEPDMATLDPAYASRLQNLYDWRASFMEKNTYIFGQIVDGVTLDRQLVDSVIGIFSYWLEQLYSDSTALGLWDAEYAKMKAELNGLVAAKTQTVTGWQTATTYDSGWVMPSETADNGHVYLLVGGGGGASGSAEPAWPTDGTTVTDGALTWRDAGPRSSSVFVVFNPAVVYPEWATNRTLTLNDKYQPTAANDNGHFYAVTSGGVTGAAEPTWPVDGGTVTDGTVTWKDLGLRGTKYSAGSIVQPMSSNGHSYIALSSGFAGSAEPVWPTDGSTVQPPFSEVTWQDLGFIRDVRMANQSAVDLSSSSDIAEFVTRYQAKMDALGITVGIVPGKSEGSNNGSAACWSDPGGEYWWTSPGYLPAFTNRIWHSVKRNSDGDIESTQEFALAIVCACSDKLMEGDTITVSIDNVEGVAKTYQLGDQFEVPVVNASPVYLSGGIDGDDTHTWFVTGNVSGRLPDYAVVNGAEIPYSSGGLAFTIFRKGLPFALGDQWSFAVEGGQFKWRKNGGAWSAAIDIPDSAVALSDGLSAEFQPGAAPSYVLSDSYQFDVRQPYSANHIRQPDDYSWRWGGAAATVTVDLGATKTLDSIVIGRHSLPIGAVVTVEGGPDGVAWPESVVMTWRAGVMLEMLAVPWNVAWLRLSVSNATDGAIGWWWAGEALATEYSAGRVRLRRNYAVTRGGGVNPSSLYAGRGVGGEVAWDTFLGQSDLDNLLEMVDHIKEFDESIVLLPHYKHPQDAAEVRVSVDDVDIADDYQFQPDTISERQLSITLPFDAVIK